MIEIDVNCTCNINLILNLVLFALPRQKNTSNPYGERPHNRRQPNRSEQLSKVSYESEVPWWSRVFFAPWIKQIYSSVVQVKCIVVFNVQWRRISEEKHCKNFYQQVGHSEAFTTLFVWLRKVSYFSYRWNTYFTPYFQLASIMKKNCWSLRKSINLVLSNDYSGTQINDSHMHAKDIHHAYPPITCKGSHFTMIYFAYSLQ